MTDCNCAAKERHDWFPLAAGDFLASDTVAECEPWEVQVYLHMMVLSWQGPGVIADRKRLAKRLGLSTEQVDEFLAGAVGDKWYECCGKLWNNRLEQEREECQRRRDAKREAGRKGGKASGKVRRQPDPERSKHEAVLKQNEALLRPAEADPKQNEANRTTRQDRTRQDRTGQTGARVEAREVGRASGPPLEADPLDDSERPEPRRASLHSVWPPGTSDDVLAALREHVLDPLVEHASRLPRLGRAPDAVRIPGIQQAVLQELRFDPGRPGRLAEVAYGSGTREKILGGVRAWLDRVDESLRGARHLKAMAEACLRAGPWPEVYQAPGFWRRAKGGAEVA